MTTSRSRIWNLVQSWWILLTLTLFFNWLAFLYLGIRARQGKWLLAGVLYFAAVAQYFVVDGAIAIDLRWLMQMGNVGVKAASSDSTK